LLPRHAVNLVQLPITDWRRSAAQEAVASKCTCLTHGGLEPASCGLWSQKQTAALCFQLKWIISRKTLVFTKLSRCYQSDAKISEIRWVLTKLGVDLSDNRVTSDASKRAKRESYFRTVPGMAEKCACMFGISAVLGGQTLARAPGKWSRRVRK
jgi:hypothetical protein